jgi:hypothetical protein
MLLFRKTREKAKKARVAAKKKRVEARKVRRVKRRVLVKSLYSKPVGRVGKKADAAVSRSIRYVFYKVEKLTWLRDKEWQFRKVDYGEGLAFSEELRLWEGNSRLGTTDRDKSTEKVAPRRKRSLHAWKSGPARKNHFMKG